MTDELKKMIQYSREDFNTLIMEKAKPIKPIYVYFRIRKPVSKDTNSKTYI